MSDLLSTFTKNISHPLYMVKDKRTRLFKYLREYEKTQFLSRQEIADLQWIRLQSILKQAYAHCPFYRRRFDAAGLDPGHMGGFDDLEKLPPTSRKDVQENLSEMVAQNYFDKRLIADKSGGSTGSPVVLYYNVERLDSREAATIRHNRWAHWEIGDKVGVVWGAYCDLSHLKRIKAKIRNFLVGRALTLDTSALTEQKIAEYAQKLARYNPDIILAYTNSLVLLARYLQNESHIQISPKGIVTTCEMLTPENRKLFEEVFNCEIFDRYGSREVSIIASECEYHEGYHINDENLFVEFVRNGKNVGPGEVGEIYITDLLNFGMPLIRYKIGDLGTPLFKKCSCGRGLSKMEGLIGRVTDLIVTPEGKMVSGVALATYMITNIKGVGQVQLVQDKVDELIIRLLKNEAFNDQTIPALLDRAELFLGKKIKFDVQHTESIEKTPTGKSLFSISKVSPLHLNVDAL